MNMAGDGMSRSPVCRTGWHLHVVCGEQRALQSGGRQQVGDITISIHCGETYEKRRTTRGREGQR